MDESGLGEGEGRVITSITHSLVGGKQACSCIQGSLRLAPNYTLHYILLAKKSKFSQLVISSLVQFGAELGAHAVSHLENVSEAGKEAMAQAGVVGVLLPTTAYILRLHPPPARRMIEKGWLSHY